MKQRGELWMNHHLLAGVVVVVLAVFAFCGVARSDNVVTANLKASPMIARPGDTVQFAAEIFHNPAFPQAPGTTIRCWVTRDDFSWVSNKVDVKYPKPGMHEYAIFASTSKFPIPSNATSGQVFNFFLVYGIWYPMSEKVSVKVFVIKKEFMQKKSQRGAN